MAGGSRVNFQLHAAPEELRELAREWQATYGLHLAAEQFFPEYRAIALDAAWDGADGQLESIRRLALRDRPLDLSTAAHSAYGLAVTNPGTLYILLEPVIDGQLGETAIASTAGEPEQADLWRRLVRRLRDGAHKGATVRNWATSAHKPSHRHLPGAHRLAERGVRMVSHKDGPEYLFDDIAPPTR